MMIYKKCYIPMVGVISSSKDRHENSFRSPKCYGEIKYTRIKDNKLNFEEVLYKTFNNDTRSIVRYGDGTNIK